MKALLMLALLWVPSHSVWATPTKMAQFIHKVEPLLARLNSFHTKMWMSDGKREQIQDYWYRRPGYYRVKQTGAFRLGFEATLRPELPDELIVSPHQWYLPSQVSLDTTSKLARAVTGDALMASDMGSLFALWQQLMKSGIIKCKLTAKPTGYQVWCDLDQPITHPYLNLDKVDRISFEFDSRFLLSKLDRWHHDKLLYQVRWEWIAVNLSLKPEFFSINPSPDKP